MADSLRDKLGRMANATESVYEANIARERLGIDPIPLALIPFEPKEEPRENPFYKGGDPSRTFGGHPDPFGILQQCQDDSPSVCPGCNHGTNLHAGGACYGCGFCGWSILGTGNAYGLEAGWHYHPSEKAARSREVARLRRIVARHRFMGSIRRPRSHPPTSRNQYRDSRTARDMARRQLGLWASALDGQDR